MCERAERIDRMTSGNIDPFVESLVQDWAGSDPHLRPGEGVSSRRVPLQLLQSEHAFA